MRGLGQRSHSHQRHRNIDDLAVGASPSLRSGTNPVAPGSDISGLTANTSYHFHAVGQNFTDLVYEADQGFATNIVTGATSAPDTYEEGPAAGTFALMQTGSSTVAVAYGLSGTATVNYRYIATSSALSIATGFTINAVTVSPIADDVYDGAWKSGNGYTTDESIIDGGNGVTEAVKA